MMMETVVYAREFLYLQELYAKGVLGKLQFLQASHQQDMDGWPNYWPGLPPMWYATHCVGPVCALPKATAAYVSCFGSGTIRPELVRQYGSPFAVEPTHIQFKDSDLSASYSEIEKYIRAYGLTSVIDKTDIVERVAEGVKSVFPIFDLQIDQKKHIEIIDAARSELADLSSELLNQVQSQAWEDGTIGKVDEKMQFKVIEFNKSAKKIILSHSRIYEDEKKAAESATRKTEAEPARKSARKAKSNVEKTTLGDITQLAAFKEEMEEKASKAAKK